MPGSVGGYFENEHRKAKGFQLVRSEALSYLAIQIEENRPRTAPQKAVPFKNRRISGGATPDPPPSPCLTSTAMLTSTPTPAATTPLLPCSRG